MDTSSPPSQTQLTRARDAGAATLTDLEVAQERIESLAAQLRAAEFANGKLRQECNRLERVLSTFAREQMQDKARTRKQAGAVRQMFATARLASDPTGRLVNTARGRVFIEVRGLPKVRCQP